ncbi:ATPase subunit of ABC transporter with duplicated ATPase domains [Pseudonocardia parietis]|uniref:ATPase subunit of ABC transporter with duplicated ATPase domains n=1 Tax=Pseudonocardia parietis TaxID=570936 RepID=A0ABS4W6Q6_9PSEU|nr:ATPase subunit of ABC transporter with duplicated ATPase domains [Pseudonocardia parietis]
MRVLAGEGEPYSGEVRSNTPVGYLPQDPREGDLSVTAKDRVLSARGLDVLLSKMEKAQTAMAELVDGPENEKAVREYGRLEERFSALGGYAAESEAARICTHLGLPDRVLEQPMRTLSGGQRRRVELARILFAASDGGSQSATTLLLDEPTNHLDPASREPVLDALRRFEGLGRARDARPGRGQGARAGPRGCRFDPANPEHR